MFLLQLELLKCSVQDKTIICLNFFKFMRIYWLTVIVSKCQAGIEVEIVEVVEVDSFWKYFTLSQGWICFFPLTLQHRLYLSPSLISLRPVTVSLFSSCSLSLTSSLHSPTYVLQVQCTIANSQSHVCLAVQSEVWFEFSSRESGSHFSISVQSDHADRNKIDVNSIPGSVLIWFVICQFIFD